MESDHDFLMFVAVDRAGRSCAAIPTAVVSRQCAQGLIGMHHDVSGAILEPCAVLEVLETFVPETRESRSEYSTVLRLALVAEARGMVLGCDGVDPTTWEPSQDPSYLAADVQTALGIISGQVHGTVEQAAHRLFALVDESDATVLGASRDVISGRLTFIGSPTGPTVSIRTHPRPE